MIKIDEFILNELNGSIRLINGLDSGQGFSTRLINGLGSDLKIINSFKLDTNTNPTRSDLTHFLALVRFVRVPKFQSNKKNSSLAKQLKLG